MGAQGEGGASSSWGNPGGGQNSARCGNCALDAAIGRDFGAGVMGRTHLRRGVSGCGEPGGCRHRDGWGGESRSRSFVRGPVTRLGRGEKKQSLSRLGDFNFGRVLWDGGGELEPHPQLLCSAGLRGRGGDGEGNQSANNIPRRLLVSSAGVLQGQSHLH